MLTPQVAEAIVTTMVQDNGARETRTTLATWQRYGKTGCREYGMPDVPAVLGTSEELLANLNLMISIWWDVKHLGL